MSEYEELMNDAAMYFKSNSFTDCNELDDAFVKYVQSRSECYSRKSIRRDCIPALRCARRNAIWIDKKKRMKHTPDGLRDRIAVTATYNQKRTPDAHVEANVEVNIDTTGMSKYAAKKAIKKAMENTK